MSLEQEVRDYIDQTMGLEASTQELTEDGARRLLLTGLMVMEAAVLMVARRVDQLEL